MKILIATLAGTASIGLGLGANGQTPPPAPPQNPAPSAIQGAAPAPTLGAKAAVIVLNNACLPLLNGGALPSVARAAGLTLKDGRWRLAVAGQRQVILHPPDTANPRLCGETIIHNAGSEPAIFAAVDAWAKAQVPPLRPDRVQDQSAGTRHLRFTSTWSGQTPLGAIGVVLTQKTALAAIPSAGTTARSRLAISLTKS